MFGRIDFCEMLSPSSHAAEGIGGGYSNGLLKKTSVL